MYNADFIKKNKVFIFLKCDPSTILIRNVKKKTTVCISHLKISSWYEYLNRVFQMVHIDEVKMRSRTYCTLL